MSLFTDPLIQQSIHDAREEAIIDFCAWLNESIITLAKRGVCKIQFPLRRGYIYKVEVTKRGDCWCLETYTDTRKIEISDANLPKIINIMTLVYKYECQDTGKKCKHNSGLPLFEIKFPIVTCQPASSTKV